MICASPRTPRSAIYVEMTAVEFQAADRFLISEIGLHRPRIALDTEINGIAAQVMGMTRAPDSRIAPRAATG